MLREEESWYTPDQVLRSSLAHTRPPPRGGQGGVEDKRKVAVRFATGATQWSLSAMALMMRAGLVSTVTSTSTTVSRPNAPDSSLLPHLVGAIYFLNDVDLIARNILMLKAIRTRSGRRQVKVSRNQFM